MHILILLCNYYYYFLLLIFLSFIINKEEPDEGVLFILCNEYADARTDASVTLLFPSVGFWSTKTEQT